MQIVDAVDCDNVDALVWKLNTLATTADNI